ncbi:MAG: Hint domain-containing protein [Yoonia sp.]|jgi:hypothetical protein|uniref:Hint domain-containing protein n=1 Tax=Yoonia sp. TaxID=2212373 RepID=UPI00273FA999|nr:Hint domain-containing protein [Yoonia sp.]MDP5086386.1 Hint domain-containing protein [Yoonia sp.]
MLNLEDLDLGQLRERLVLLRSAIVEDEELSAEREAIWTLPGFGAGARVATGFGQVPVEALRLRDPVKTRDGLFLQVKHIDTIRLDRRFLLTHPDAQPVEIPKNSLAANAPNRDVLLSGGQKIRLPGRLDQTVGKPAKDCAGVGKVQRKHQGYFTYYVFHCGEPCVASVDGLWVDIDPTQLKAP